MQGALSLTLAALAGCNQVYGLDSTQLRDGAPPDAPYACTDQPPDLRGKPIEIVGGRDAARSYSISIDRRIAVAERTGTLVEGPGDGPLSMPALLMPAPSLPPGSPRLAPEGDELFVRYYSAISPSSPATVERYQREGNVWARRATILMINGAIPDISAPTRRDAGPRRMLVLHSTIDLREMIETAPDVWMQVGAYTAAELGATAIQAPNLTPDGLHLVYSGQTASGPVLGYTSRPEIGARFSVPAVDANPFFGSPAISDPFLTEDCARLYFYVLAKPPGVYYVERD